MNLGVILQQWLEKSDARLFYQKLHVDLPSLIKEGIRDFLYKFKIPDTVEKNWLWLTWRVAFIEMEIQFFVWGPERIKSN